MAINANSWVSAMHAYVPGEQPKEHDVVKLNTNEAPYPASPEVTAAVNEAASSALFNKYPDPSCSSLRNAISGRLDVTPEEIIVGNGSDEILRMLVHAFTEPGNEHEIAVTDPTYVLYQTLGEMFGVNVKVYPLVTPNFQLSQSLIEAPAKIVFLPNPNPPIGTYFTSETLDTLAAFNPNRLIVIDEAYVDFAPGNAMDVYRKYPNVVVSRTFSKSYSLAGLRVGFLVARPELTESLNKIKDSYNVNRISQAAAFAAWNSVDYYRNLVGRIIEDREYLKTELEKRSFKVSDSHGNFVFARCKEAKALYLALKERKVLVRYFDLDGLRDGMRITIGTRAELDRLLIELDSLTDLI